MIACAEFAVYSTETVNARFCAFVYLTSRKCPAYTGAILVSDACTTTMHLGLITDTVGIVVWQPLGPPERFSIGGYGYADRDDRTAPD